MSTQVTKVKVGEVLSETQFYVVTGVNSKTNSIDVKNDAGLEFTIEGTSLIGGLNSASQYTDTIEVTRTELADIFKKNMKTAMTVNFNTKVDAKEVAEKVSAIYPNNGKIASRGNFEAQVKKVIKDALNGEERTMTGRHNGFTDDFGRVGFTDMSIVKDDSKSYDNRLRLVDPRTINWLIVNGVKFTQK